jgi:hypothetical protein
MRRWLVLMIPFALMAQRFEVASVKPAAMRPTNGGRNGGGMGCPQSIKLDGGRLDIACATLPTLIGYAFRLPPDRVNGPDWMISVGAPRFDIQAKLPDGATKDQVPGMVETVYALVVAKGGPKLQDAGASTPAAPGEVNETEGPNRTQRWEASNINAEGLAELVDRALPLPTPVSDMTGLTGRYRLVLEVSLNDLPGLGAPMEMEDAVLARFNQGLGKLGLQLERRKGPLKTIMVRSAEKTPTAN